MNNGADPATNAADTMTKSADPMMTDVTGRRSTGAVCMTAVWLAACQLSGFEHFLCSLESEALLAWGR